MKHDVVKSLTYLHTRTYTTILSPKTNDRKLKMERSEK